MTMTTSNVIVLSVYRLCILSREKCTHALSNKEQEEEKKIYLVHIYESWLKVFLFRTSLSDFFAYFLLLTINSYFIIHYFSVIVLRFFLGWDVRHFEHDVIYWDIVVVTTLDIVQKEAYDALIQQRSTINRIPLGVDYLVITDPGKIGKSYYVILIVIVLL